MSESNEKQAGFWGTYFDRDGVLRLSRWADIFAWIVLAFYLLNGLVSILLYLGQFYNGMYMDKGATLLDQINTLAQYLQPVLPGVFYFFGLQAVSKGLLIFLDMEDNTRRAARNK